MRPQTMTVLALMCLAGSSPAVSAAWRAPMPSEIPAAQSLPAATQAAVWFAGETALPTGVALLASGQWMPVRDGRWLWIAYDQGSERAAPSFKARNVRRHPSWSPTSTRTISGSAGGESWRAPDQTRPSSFTPRSFLAERRRLASDQWGEPASSRRPAGN
jgi:hypothetical protein